jgi:dynein heavy chain
MNKIIFDCYLEDHKDDENYPSYLEMPPPPPAPEVPYFGMMELERTKGVKEKWMFKYDEVHYAEPKDFTETFKDFCFASLFIKEEVIKAL